MVGGMSGRRSSRRKSIDDILKYGDPRSPEDREILRWIIDLGNLERELANIEDKIASRRRDLERDIRNLDYCITWGYINAEDCLKRYVWSDSVSIVEEALRLFNTLYKNIIKYDSLDEDKRDSELYEQIRKMIEDINNEAIRVKNNIISYRMNGFLIVANTYNTVEVFNHYEAVIDDIESALNEKYRNGLINESRYKAAKTLLMFDRIALKRAYRYIKGSLI